MRVEGCHPETRVLHLPAAIFCRRAKPARRGLFTSRCEAEPGRGPACSSPGRGRKCGARPAADGIGRAVLGDGAVPFHATLFEKTPVANWLVVWHQDTALPLLNQNERAGWGPWSLKEGVTYAHPPASALSKVLALRLHLDDSTTQNGPLRVLPGTQRLAVLTDDAIHELSHQIGPVDCLTEAGG
jgi:Phytanoyl-CoA dioxygenase (PhyH)